MRRSLRGESPGKICISIVEATLTKALNAIKEAAPLADLLELRMDYLSKPGLPTLMEDRQKPFIVTNRRREEGGRYQGDERRRVEILEKAIDLGAEYMDVEMDTERSWLHDLITDRKGTQVILSFHDFQGTPSQETLGKLYEQMTQLRPDIVKIVTFAKSWEDNFRVLSLIPHARGRKQKIIAFCMGEMGKMSRIFAPLMGAAWTYASLSKERTSAPGQLTIREMREIWERLR